TEIYTLSLHDALPIYSRSHGDGVVLFGRRRLHGPENLAGCGIEGGEPSVYHGNVNLSVIDAEAAIHVAAADAARDQCLVHFRIRSEEHTSELQSRGHL